MASEEFKRDLNRLAEILEAILIGALEKRGLRATGDLINSVKVKVKEFIGGVSLTGEFNFYGAIMDTGVKPGRVPFNPGSGAKTSLYIAGLQRWIRIKGFAQGAKKVLGMAFAIAKKHKKVGIPVDKKKIGWMTDTIIKEEGRITKEVERAIDKDMTLIIDNLVRETQVVFDLASK